MIFKLTKHSRHQGYLKLLYAMLIFTGIIVFMFLNQNLSNLSKNIRLERRPGCSCRDESRSGCTVVLNHAPSFIEPTPKEGTWKNNTIVKSNHPDSTEITLHNDDEKPLNVAATFNKSCQPRKHLFFLKTHKTASSTIMNMLFRFGESHNLNFALPAYNHSQFFYPYFFNAYFVEGFIRNRHPHYDIMCHHMRFLLTEVEKVIPNDTFYFTILRNPVSLMESSFSYYKATDLFGQVHSLNEFLRNPYKYYNKSKIFKNYGRNLMTFDLGFNPDGVEKAKHMLLTHKAIETMFDLVLITEYFDESLILLKDALCWTFDDVISFPLNSRSNTSRKDLSFETQEMIKAWNQLDWQLYIYFNSSFWKQVDKFGRDRMQREVQELQKTRAKLSEMCLEGQVDPKKITDKSLQPFQAGLSRILGYNLKPGLGKREQLLCQRYVMPELQYTQLLQNAAQFNLNEKSTRHKNHIFEGRRKQQD